MRAWILMLILICFVDQLSVPAATSALPDEEPESVTTDPQSPAERKGRKRALLIGVSDYCRGAEKDCERGGQYWWNLSGGVDVEAIKLVLAQERFGFQEIRTLTTREETTRESIKKAFEALISQTTDGDIVYIHYSGHGSQVPDDAKRGNLKVGDEIDGLDETIVPSDYISQKDGANDIRDDQIEQWIAQLIGKKAANVTLTFDSCHSGTTTRNGSMRPRGMPYQGPPVQARPANDAQADAPGGFFQMSFAERNKLVAITASRDEQLAQEWLDQTRTPRGVLTHALIEALNSSTDKTTYRELFDQVSDAVTASVKDQNPQMEGNRNLLLFSGLLNPPEPYVRVSVQDGRPYLKAGFLQGMTYRSRFTIYPTGARRSDTTAPIAEAEIIHVDPNTSRIKIIPPPNDEQMNLLKNAVAYETMHRLGDGRLKVDARLISGSARGSEIMSELKGVELASAEGEGQSWNVRICKSECPDEKRDAAWPPASAGNYYTLQRADGSVICRVAEDQNAGGKIRRAIQSEARWRFVKQLKNKKDSPVEFRLVPVSAEFDKEGNVVSTKRLAEEVGRTEGGEILLYEKVDLIMLEVRNTGTQPAFVTILDLRSDGRIAPMWPHPNVPVGKSGENRVPPDRNWVLIPLPCVFRIKEPLGPELFKAIVTLDEAD
ncbi:MAG TPA: caspase family protein, partial [Blastocatellia bacterium]|nr:caspase family protein [Blastocatellia bacterium]